MEPGEAEALWLLITKGQGLNEGSPLRLRGVSWCPLTGEHESCGIEGYSESEGEKRNSFC